MAQQVQLLGTLVHEPRLVVFDEPFSGLDAINQGKLERLIRSLAEKGTTVIFSTHVIAHAERLCDEVAIIAGGKVPFAGPVDAARDRIPAQVRLETRASRRAVARGAARRCAARGHVLVFLAARKRHRAAAARADRRRGGHPLAVDRARRPARRLRRHRRRGGRTRARGRRRRRRNDERNGRLLDLAAAAWSSPGATSPRSCSAARSSSSCSAPLFPVAVGRAWPAGSASRRSRPRRAPSSAWHDGAADADAMLAARDALAPQIGWALPELTVLRPARSGRAAPIRRPSCAGPISPPCSRVR